jgi:hypothetical protein
MAGAESQLSYALQLQTNGGDTGRDERDSQGTERLGTILISAFLYVVVNILLRAGSSPSSLLTPCLSFHPPPPNALPVFIKVRALMMAPLSNPVMNLILLRMESAIVQSLWEVWKLRGTSVHVFFWFLIA